ncbi:MAG: C10 family peptidase, partial [Candidatus Zixiibacteriota bacterium]
DFLQKINEKEFLVNDSVGPLLTTRWHQGSPYNDYCPIGCNNSPCVVGCVATAMAQLMTYYQWPIEGYGSKRYSWEGDYSCGDDPCVGSKYLEVEFNDPYDWDNIPDYCSSCSEEEQTALAELNYEVGVACSMDYGVCGSGANPDPSVLPNYFRYKNDIIEEFRFYHNQESWFELIKNEIDLGRPLLYYIVAHAIVCDGYKDLAGILLYYHMNYGWGGSNNMWYAFDDLYYPEGGNYNSDYLFRNITPDKRAWFTADTLVGWAPFEVNFTGESELASVRTWSWNFGDGGTGAGQNSTHIYENSGLFDCTLKVTDMSWITYDCPKQDYIIILADTVSGSDITGPFDSTLEIPINVTNSQPLYRLDIPIEWDANLELQFLGHTLDSCRTATFQYDSYINYNVSQKRFCLNLETGTGDTLEAGSGPVVILKFKILSAPLGKTVTLQTDGYTGYMPGFYSPRAVYTPMSRPGSISYEGCCIGTTGNIDCSALESPDITDITRLIDYIYLSRRPLCCLEEADCNGSGGEPDISDVTLLIDNLYLSGMPLSGCPD